MLGDVGRPKAGLDFPEELAMFRQRPGLSLAVLALGALAPLAATEQSDEDAGFVPVTDAMLQDPAPGDWLTWRRTPNGWGYSPLDQIDQDNVGELRMVWTRALGAGSQQGTPLAYGGVLYMPNPRDVIQAMDAVTGDLLWEYRRARPDDLDDHVAAGLSEAKRNIAIYGDLIISTSADDYAYALDAATGRLAWETQILDYTVNPAHQSSGPIIAGGKAVSGRGCMPEGGPEACVVVAHDARTGEEVWRTTLALDGDTGEIRWYYQHLNDHWDLDHPFERLLVDTAVVPDPSAVSWINPRIQPGDVRRVVTGIPGKTGVVYTLDRATGEFLWATPTITQNVIADIDGATGAVTESAELVFSGRGEREIRPSFGNNIFVFALPE